VSVACGLEAVAIVRCESAHSRGAREQEGWLATLDAAVGGREPVTKAGRSRIGAIKQALSNARGPLGVLAAVSFVSSLGIGVMLPLLPLYAVSLGATPLQLGLMTGGFRAHEHVGQLLAGVYIDRGGSLRVVRLGTGVYAAANALIATVHDASALIGFRGMAGLGTGADQIGSRIYLARIARAERMGFVNGVLGSAGAAGTVLGPAFGGTVVALFDLRAPFVIVAVTSTLALGGLLTLAMPKGEPAPATTDTGSMFNRPVITLLLANTLLATGFGGFITTYAPFATQIRGWSTFEVGLLFTAAGAGAVAFGAGLGLFADKTGRRRLAIVATIPASLMGLGIVFDLAHPLLYALMFIAGGGMAGFTASWFALLNEAAPKGRKGRTIGVVSALSNVGTIAGALGASALWQLVGLPYSLVLASGFILTAGLALVALPSDGRPVRSLALVEPALDPSAGS